MQAAAAAGAAHRSTKSAAVVLRFLTTCSGAHLCRSFLPARPERNLIEGRRMTDSFIEARRVALERYLNRLAAHPAACRSEVGCVKPARWLRAPS
jgi:hypothetical protein